MTPDTTRRATARAVQVGGWLFVASAAVFILGIWWVVS